MIEERAGHPEPMKDQAVLMESIGEFLLSLIQAFLRTGYYLPDHPESRKAKEGLFEKFHGLVGSSGEITFLLRQENGSKNVYIEGLGGKHLRLADTMLRGMAETYNPRFVIFLERKELISLSLSARMNSGEFSRFIDLMSEPFLEDMKERASKAKFLTCLKERHIKHLSFVFDEDFISEHRNIPWRATMALSRLKKDLSLVPVFRDLQQEEIGQVRREVLADIMRPLNVPELVYSFLMNLDLAQTPDLPEEEAENEVFAMVNERVFLTMSSIFIKDASEKEVKYKKIFPQEKFARLLGKFCSRLNKIDQKEAKDRIEEMFNEGLLSLEDLTPEVKDRIQTVQQAMSFLDQQDTYLKHFENTTDSQEYSRRSRIMAKIVPHLFERGKYAYAVSITEKLSNHAKEVSERGAMARETLLWLSKTNSLQSAREAFLTVSKEDRIFLGAFFIQMGQWSAPYLLSIVNQTDDIWKRKHAAELLTKLGPAAASSLTYELEQGNVPPETLSTIIRVLGNVTEESIKSAAVKIIKEKVNDQDPEVRCEALQALIRLSPRIEYELFLEKIEDPDVRTQKIAARGIGLSGDHRAIEILCSIVERAKKSGAEIDWEVASAALTGIGHLYEVCPEARNRIRSFFLDLAEKGFPAGAWKKIFGRSHGLPDTALAALAESLGRIGGAEAKQILRRMADEGEKDLSRKAGDVLRRLPD